MGASQAARGATRTFTRSGMVAAALVVGLAGVAGMSATAGAATRGGGAHGATSRAALKVGTRSTTDLLAVTAGTGTGTGTGTASTSVPGGGTTSATHRRARLEEALSRRQSLLEALTSSVGSDTELPASVRRTLETQLRAETSGIGALVSDVPTEPASQLVQTAATMIDQYRVYLVMLPKVKIAEQAARQAVAEAKGTAAEPAIEARIEAAQGNGVTVIAAQSAYQDLVAKLSQAAADTQAADVAAVLALSPAGYPADASPLSTARSELAAAKSLLPAIKADLQIIRDAVGGSSPGS